MAACGADGACNHPVTESAAPTEAKATLPAEVGRQWPIMRVHCSNQLASIAGTSGSTVDKADLGTVACGLLVQ